MEIILDEGLELSKDLLGKIKEAGDHVVLMECRRKNLDLDISKLEVSLTLVDLEEIHQLNLEYRNVDRPTDVLSFPQFEALEDVSDIGEMILGDVVICLDKVREQAEEFGHSFDRELVYLFTHSILHLLGYDHMDEEEKAVMREREEETMTSIGLER